MSSNKFEYDLCYLLNYDIRHLQLPQNLTEFFLIFFFLSIKWFADMVRINHINM